MKNVFFKDLGLFGKAFQSTKHEIWVSVKLLALITVLFAIAMFLAEHSRNPGFSIWDGLVWTFVKYVEDPADIADAPVTLVGKIVGTLVGVLGIAIFAVPAGLIGSGLIDAMEDEKKEAHLKEVRQSLLKAFRRSISTNFKEYVNATQDGANKFYFAPRKVSIAKLEVRGLKKDDVIDAVNTFPEFRLKNMATAMSSEEQPEDRLVVEHYPLNTDYGCKIDRKSNITILTTNGCSEVGMSWFGYHLAKLGGFNFISKDLEVDPEESDSFYSMPAQVKVNGVTKSELRENANANKELLELLQLKKERREAFLKDLRDLCDGKDHWCIMLLSAIKNKANTDDFHFAYAKKGGVDPTVLDMDSYQKMFADFQNAMQEEFQLSAIQSKRYPLVNSNLGYKLQKEGYEGNAFTIRISTYLINFDSRVHVALYRMAEIMNNAFHGQGMLPADLADFKKRPFGYPEVENDLGGLKG